jgi:hypothetical protein
MVFDQTTNPGGLSLFIGGQQVLQAVMPFFGLVVLSSLSLTFFFGLIKVTPLTETFLKRYRLGPGNYPHTVEIYRGPLEYNYDPVTLQFESVCDFLQIYSDVYFTVSWVRPCAAAEFYSPVFKTFTVDSKM